MKIQEDHLKTVSIAGALILAGCIGLTAGCSDDSDSAKKAAPVAPKDRPMTEKELRDEKSRRIFNPTPEERAEDQAAEAARQAELHKDDAVTTQLPAPDAAPALADYLPLEMGYTVLGLYNAYSPVPDTGYQVANNYGLVQENNMPVTDEQLGKYLVAFSHTRDEFERRDNAKAIEAIVQKQVDALKGKRYVKIDMPHPEVATYDFEKLGFTQESNLYATPLTEEQVKKAQGMLSYGHRMPPDRGHIQWSDVSEYKVELSNGQDYQFVPVADEQLARTLEKLSKSRKWAATAYGYVDGVKQGERKTTDTYRTVFVHVQQLDFYEEGKPGNVLVSMKK
jgi:hypothetical protein